MGGRAHPIRIGGPAAASLLVNALLIAALLGLGMGRASRRTDAPPLTVLSLAALKGVDDGEEAAEAATPSAPLPTSAATPPPTPPMPIAPPSVAVQPAPPPMILVPSVLPRPMPIAALPQNAAAASAPATPTQSATSAPSPSAPPARRGVADGLDANAPSGTSRSYAAKIRSWLYAHKIYPRRARMRREEGLVRVRFVIDRAGMLVEGVIVQGSGNPTLDQEANAMMHRASPFPKAPIEIAGERIEFTAPIEFTLPV